MPMKKKKIILSFPMYTVIAELKLKALKDFMKLGGFIEMK